MDHSKGKPLQIISLKGEGEECECELNQQNLDEIFNKIPRGHEVSILSVVGGFRSGKSFILNLVLRYLRSQRTGDIGESWMTEEGEKLSEGNANKSSSTSSSGSNASSEEESKSDSSATLSFAWKGGDARTTTGIWMWSEPFIRKTKKFQGAILIMDTQGMFDNQTSMNMTAQIFGLSTLVSAYQVYNVEKMIGEDKLQHLALFSEYGRMAFKPSSEKIPGDEEGKEEASAPVSAGRVPEKKMFQRLQFLVRDYQNLNSDDLDASTWYSDTPKSQADKMARMEKSMATYFSNVITPKSQAKDLTLTREQISRCFQTVDCFCLPHPGRPVTKQNFDGSIKEIEGEFRIMVNRFIRKMIEEELEAKRINDRNMTGPELKIFFESYFSIIRDSKNKIPAAMTMLEASCTANNRSAFSVGLEEYKFQMDSSLGIVAKESNKGSAYDSLKKSLTATKRIEPSWVKDEILIEYHNKAYKIAFAMFDERAKMGPPAGIQKFRDNLKTKIEEDKSKYFENNSLRNPYKDTEQYALPVAIGAGSWFASKFLTIICDANICVNISNLLSKIFLLLLIIFIAMTWEKLKGVFLNIMQLTGNVSAATKLKAD